MVTKTVVPATRTRTRKSADNLPSELVTSAKPRPKKRSISANDRLMLQQAQQQKELLDRAMEAFEPIAPNREQFAELIGVSKRGLDKWLYPYVPGRPRSEQDCREMPEPVRRLLIVMMEQPPAARLVQRLARQHRESEQGKIAATKRNVSTKAK